MVLILAVGSNLATTFPCLSTKNFVKFHLISGLVLKSGYLVFKNAVRAIAFASVEK